MINNVELLLNHRIVQCQGNIVSDMDGEKVMMNINNGNYYNLGRMGGTIWELLASPISTSKLVEALMNEYEVEQAVCEEQVISFLKRLLDENLIQFAEELHPQLQP
ncbi:lasso peptide biosynthesis PqqD family chaperone [Paenibacillus sp. FSL H8-0034]|uniref:lasso peptide biosynthesis PqqD family chaperone n=1 Tax=Paenibacillus sp. FSL H8-0034 TaxID=2954671 RepID=UPI0030F710FE